MTGIALVRRPGERLAEGIVTHAERRPVDVDQALRQHAEYVAALRGAGWDVLHMPVADDLPDSPFVEDTVVVAGDVAVLTRPGARQRRGEVAATEHAVRALGLNVASITEPGTLDGGDVLQVGDTVYVGIGERTNNDGFCQLARELGTVRQRVLPVELQGCLHLKSAVTALPDGTLIGTPERVDLATLGPVRVLPEESGGHVVVLGERNVLIAASAPRTAELLVREGLAVTVVDISEFEKLEGSVTCLSVLIPG